MLKLNEAMLNIEEISSEFITPPIDWIAPIPNKKIYKGKVEVNQEVVAYFTIEGNESSLNEQLNIDLDNLDDLNGSTFDIRPSGYVYVKADLSDLSHQIFISSNDGEEKISHAQLKANHYLVFTLAIPGKYTLIDESVAEANLSIVVKSPVQTPPEEGYEPVIVNVSDRGFSPDSVELEYSQSLVIDCKEDSKIKITAVMSDTMNVKKMKDELLMDYKNTKNNEYKNNF